MSRLLRRGLGLALLVSTACAPSPRGRAAGPAPAATAAPAPTAVAPVDGGAGPAALAPAAGATATRAPFELFPASPRPDLPPEAARFLDSLSPPPAALSSDEPTLRRALGLEDGAPLGDAVLDHDVDGAPWAVLATPAGRVPLTRLDLARGRTIPCRLGAGNTLSKTYLVRGAAFALAVQLRGGPTAIAVDAQGRCTDHAKLAFDELAVGDAISASEVPAAPGALVSLEGPLLGAAPGQRLDVFRDRLELHVGARVLARSDSALWPPLTGRPLHVEAVGRRPDGGFVVRLRARRPAATPPPFPSFRPLARDHDEEEAAVLAVLPDGRVLPLSAHRSVDPWELGTRDPFLCEGDRVARCDDRVLAHELAVERVSDFYEYRSMGVLRWTTRTTGHRKVTVDPGKTCVHTLADDVDESTWTARSFGEPTWYELSTARAAGHVDTRGRRVRCPLDD